MHGGGISVEEKVQERWKGAWKEGQVRGRERCIGKDRRDGDVGGASEREKEGHGTKSSQLASTCSVCLYIRTKSPPVAVQTKPVGSAALCLCG